MNPVRPRLNARIHHGTSRVAELRRVIAGLDVELGQSIRWWPLHESGTVQEVHQVRVVVHAVENKVVLRRALTISDKVAFGRSTGVA
jgi:hypothetical protein